MPTADATHEHPCWVFPTACLLVALASGAVIALLAGGGLETADQLSSVGGFLVAFIVAAASLLAWTYRRQTVRRPATEAWDGADRVHVGLGRIEQAPPFPASWPGYRPDGEDRHTTVRLFNDDAPGIIHDFPVTMNGCSHQLFFVRWRTLGGEQVQTRLYAFDMLPYSDDADGLASAGWIRAHGCAQPGWSLPTASIGIVDLQVTWQRWLPTA